MRAGALGVAPRGADPLYFFSRIYAIKAVAYGVGHGIYGKRNRNGSRMRCANSVQLITVETAPPRTLMGSWVLGDFPT